MRVLTASEMRQIDKRAIEELGIPGPVLMENAAIGLADALGECFPQAESVTLLCGPGNNGGDGLALARHLEGRGYRCRVVLVVGKSPPRGDAKLQLDILERSGFEIWTLRAEDDLDAVLAACDHCNLIVDALFGTGLSRPLEGHFAALVEALGDLTTPCLAVDIPSGLDGSSHRIVGPHAPAAVTVTFAAPKVAHVLEPASRAMGRLVVTDLGIPSFLLDTAPGDLHLLLRQEVAGYLAGRPSDGHKGTFGHALLVAGSPGKAGAAVLACRAAGRSGAGLVTVAVPEPLLMTVDGASLESMTAPLPWTPEGGLDLEAVAQVVALGGGKQALAIGPGLGTAGTTPQVVRELAQRWSGPLLLDADGLNAFTLELSGSPVTDEPDDLPIAQLQQRATDGVTSTVLTPHPGEMGRLLGMTSREVQQDRLAAVRRAAKESGAIVILKGGRSLVAEPDGGVWINPTGNVALASGGTGDVLSGLLVGLLAQGYEPLAAAQLAVFWHGLAADLWIADHAPESLLANDLVNALGAALQELKDD